MAKKKENKKLTKDQAEKKRDKKIIKGSNY